MSWVKTIQKVPVFKDQNLLDISTRHKHGCTIVRKKRCSCLSTDHFLLENTICQILMESEDTNAIKIGIDENEVWIEKKATRPCEPPQKENTEAQYRPPTFPPDYRFIQEWLLSNKIETKNKRRPKGGELVIIEDEISSGKTLHIWRLFSRIDDLSILIDPTLRYEQALNPSWDQIKKTEDKIVPIFPLPDEIDSPGWIVEWNKNAE